MYNILILKGIDDSFVDVREYEGRIPPELTQIQFVGERAPYTLTIHEFKGSRYLFAHELPLKKHVADRVIESLQPRPL
ncbi:hypothetical protein [Tatumella punctata]|uniref:KTSC domain-containing protein n=1 Tax=Tatumella punctata TaxID=399969 RepID=A0ABW1VRS4_9GAMM